jgi:hypothetical protein
MITSHSLQLSHIYPESCAMEVFGVQLFLETVVTLRNESLMRLVQTVPMQH